MSWLKDYPNLLNLFKRSFLLTGGRLPGENKGPLLSPHFPKGQANKYYWNYLNHFLRLFSQIPAVEEKNIVCPTRNHLHRYPTDSLFKKPKGREEHANPSKY